MKRGIGRAIAASVVGVCGLSTSAGASVVYVRAGATGAGNGTSWTNAYTSLAPALAGAAAGDEIWVAEGTYRPAGAGGDRASTFALRNGVSLYGGFSGVETAKEQRNWTLHPTILSGDLTGDDGPQFANMADNCFHVVVAVNVDATAVLDGFIIRGGRADGPGFGASPASCDQGSGVNVFDATPLVQNCTLEENWAANHGTFNDHGNATVIDCVFRNNYAADHGAGLYSHHEAATVARGCRFENNEAAHDGGAAFSRSMTGAVYQDCTFVANHAERGAGMWIDLNGNATLTNCTFTSNVASVGGGGIFADVAMPQVIGCVFTGNSAGVGVQGGGGGGGGSGGGGFWASGGNTFLADCGFYENQASFGGGVYNNEGSTATVFGCIFRNNVAQEAGGLYALSSPVSVRGCLFENNRAAGSVFSVGGGMSSYFSNTSTWYCRFVRNSAEIGGGGIYCEGESPVITLCQFLGNSANEGAQGFGGGLMNGYMGTTTVQNCGFVGNRANEGGAIFNIFSSTPFIRGCTMTANASALGGGVRNAINVAAAMSSCVVWGNAPDQLSGTGTSVAYSLIQGGASGPGVIDADPAFVRAPSAGPDGLWGTADDDYGDLSPRPGSRCIDAGDSASVGAEVTMDLATLTRRRDDAGTPDTGAGAPPVVDIGAYEFQGTTCYANCDGSTASPVLNIADFVCYLSRFASGDALANCDGSTVAPALNVGDFVCFMNRFAAGCP